MNANKGWKPLAGKFEKEMEKSELRYFVIEEHCTDPRDIWDEFEKWKSSYKLKNGKGKAILCWML